MCDLRLEPNDFSPQSACARAGQRFLKEITRKKLKYQAKTRFFGWIQILSETEASSGESQERFQPGSS